MEHIFADNSRQAGVDNVEHNRHAPRDSLFLMANMRVGDEMPVQTRVRNLSAGGMMADYARPVGIGTPVSTELRNIGLVEGHVAWCAEGRIGVAFEAEIDPKTARKPVGQGDHTPTYVKPILPIR